MAPVVVCEKAHQIGSILSSLCAESKWNSHWHVNVRDSPFLEQKWMNLCLKTQWKWRAKLRAPSNKLPTAGKSKKTFLWWQCGWRPTNKWIRIGKYVMALPRRAQVFSSSVVARALTTLSKHHPFLSQQNVAFFSFFGFVLVQAGFAILVGSQCMLADSEAMGVDSMTSICSIAMPRESKMHPARPQSSNCLLMYENTNELWSDYIWNWFLHSLVYRHWLASLYLQYTMRCKRYSKVMTTQRTITLRKATTKWWETFSYFQSESDTECCECDSLCSSRPSVCCKYTSVTRRTDRVQKVTARENAIYLRTWPCW